MGINDAQLRGLTARELISPLIRDGFALDRQVGAHQHCLHPEGRRVTVSFHRPGETFGIKTLRAMIELQAGWSEDDLKRLKLMKSSQPEQPHLRPRGPQRGREDSAQPTYPAAACGKLRGESDAGTRRSGVPTAFSR